MSLLSNAGEVLLWCVGAVIGVAGVAVAALYAWDKWHQRKLSKHWNEGRR